MCFWLLPITGVPIARTTIQALSPEELENDEIKSQLTSYDLTIGDKLSHDLGAPIVFSFHREDREEDLCDDESMEPESSAPNVEDTEADMYDTLLLTEPVLLHEGEPTRAKIVGRKRDQDGNLVGRFNPNPLLNTRIYLAEFLDGHIMELGANMITDAIFNQIDDDANDIFLFKEIIGHEYDSMALTKEEKKMIDDLQLNNGTVIRNQNNIHPLYTTRGWKICVEWKDGTTSWLPLAGVKNSFPVHLAEYAINNKLQDYPAFSWWVNYTLKKKRSFLKSTKSTYSQRTHKFGIKVPRTVQEALAIDQQTGTTHWYNAIQKEMTNNKAAFQFLDDNERVPVGYKWIKCHMIFDVKMDFTRKARFVAGGHMTNPPKSITYSSVVSRDSVRIAFLLAALNDVDILSTDIGNTYLNALPREKVFTTAGPEFGSESEGKSVLIVCALYGLKSSGAAWRSHLANTLHQLGFISCVADPDVWMRSATKPMAILIMSTS